MFDEEKIIFIRIHRQKLYMVATCSRMSNPPSSTTRVYYIVFQWELIWLILSLAKFKVELFRNIVEGMSIVIRGLPAFSFALEIFTSPPKVKYTINI